MSTTLLRLVESAAVVRLPPTAAVSPQRKHELLSAVIAVLDEVSPQFGDRDAWKWACIGIRDDMAEAIGLVRDAVSCPASSVPPLQLAAAPAG